MPVLPQFLAKPVAAAARQGFNTSITKMAKLLKTPDDDQALTSSVMPSRATVTGM